MVFSSILFLVYFLPVFLLVYYVVPNKLKNTWLVICSLAFYVWGAPSFLPALLLSCLLDFFSTFYFSNKNKKLWFTLVLVSNISMLLYFKYANFFTENLNFILALFNGSQVSWKSVVLPIGISFLTFQKISYLVDVYRGDCQPQKSFIDYLLFIVLFPHSIAGPIVRYKDIHTQLTQRFGAITPAFVYLGLFQFVMGLSKKVFIANPLGAQADLIFNNLNALDFYGSWLGIICYTFQIYFDFSGYSDMAIGLGKMMGFVIPVNFNFPYTARSITEFWKRWHITLGSWMKDYLYIPLGGNKFGLNRTYFNLFTVFLISGFWHGASWNFVIWGAFHGSFLVIERLGFNGFLKKLGVFSIVYTFVAVLVGWVFFRLDTFSEAFIYLNAMFQIPKGFLSMNNLPPLRVMMMLIVGSFFAFQSVANQTKLNALLNGFSAKPAINYSFMFVVVLFYLLNLGELFATGFNPFIYFKF